MSSWLDAYFIGITGAQSGGAALPSLPLINFGAGLSATPNVANNRLDVSAIGGAISYEPTLDATSASVVAGDSALSAATGNNANVTRATAAAIPFAPGAAGIVTVAASPGGTPTVQTTGVVATGITGLGNGGIARVAVNPATGKLARVAYPDGSETGVGTVDTHGNVTVTPSAFVGTAPHHVFNPKGSPYMATGDGSADDTTAVQSALTAAIAVGGVLLIPKNTTFKTTATLVGGSNVTIMGEGPTSVIKPTGSGAAISFPGVMSNFRLRDFQIDASSGPSVTDGIYLAACQQSVISGVIVTGGRVGLSRACLTFDGASSINCYAIHVTGACVFQTAAGDGIYAVPSPLTHEFSIDGRTVIQDNAGWGLRNFNDGSTSAVECSCHGVLFEANALGEVTGSYWSSGFYHCHFETVSSGAGAPFKIAYGPIVSSGMSQPVVSLSGTPTQTTDSIELDVTTGGTLASTNVRFTWKLNGVVQQTAQVGAATFVLGATGLTANFAAGTYTTDNNYKTASAFRGLVLVGNFFENHQSGAAGSYDVELNPTVSSQGLVAHGNFFDLNTVAGFYLGALARGYIGPNNYNGAAFSPYPPVSQGGLFIQDPSAPSADLQWQQQDGLRDVAFDFTTIAEDHVVKTGLLTTGAGGTATFDLPIAPPMFGPAGTTTCSLDATYEVSGRDLANSDQYRATLRALVYNTAGVITNPSIPSAANVLSNYPSGHSGAAAALTVSGTNLRLTVTGVSASANWGWAVKYSAVWRP